MRKLYIIGDIDFDAFAKFTEELTELEQESDEPISVSLVSEGGLHEASLAFAARIRLSPCDIWITAAGIVASAAVMVLAYGDYRFMAKEAWVMVHEESMKISDNVSNIEATAANLRTMEDQAALLLMERTKTSAAEWSRLHKKSSYLSAQQCLELGLIEEIV